MSGNIPQWAKDRANVLFDVEEKVAPCVTSLQWHNAFARYIAAHEAPPVDPLREEAIRIVLAEAVTRTGNQIEAIRSGRAGEGKVDLVLTALRRGIELASSQD